MPDNDKKIPEWDFMARIDELETITLKIMDKTDATEPTLRTTHENAHDAYILAELLLVKDFLDEADTVSASELRKEKDKILSLLEANQVSKRHVEHLSMLLSRICDQTDKRFNG